MEYIHLFPNEEFTVRLKELVIESTEHPQVSDKLKLVYLYLSSEFDRVYLNVKIIFLSPEGYYVNIESTL